MQPLTNERTFTCEAAIASLSSSSGLFSQGMSCWGITSASWESAFADVSTAPSSLPPHSQAEGPGKAEKACLSILCHRREAGTMSSYMKTKLWGFSFLSPHARHRHRPFAPHVHKFWYSNENVGCSLVPHNPKRESSYSLPHTQSALNSHTLSSSSTPPQLTSESPGALVKKKKKWYSTQTSWATLGWEWR